MGRRQKAFPSGPPQLRATGSQKAAAWAGEDFCARIQTPKKPQGIPTSISRADTSPSSVPSTPPHCLRSSTLHAGEHMDDCSAMVSSEPGLMLLGPRWDSLPECHHWGRTCRQSRQSRQHGMGREQKASPGWAPSSCSEGGGRENKPEELCTQKQPFLLHGEVCSLDQNKGPGVLVPTHQEDLPGWTGQGETKRRPAKSHRTQADKEQMSFHGSAVPTGATRIPSMQTRPLTLSQQATQETSLGLLCPHKERVAQPHQSPAQCRGWAAQTT